MKVQAFAAHASWLLFITGFVSAHPATLELSIVTELQLRSEGGSLGSEQLSIADIPPCGIRCLVEYVPASGCSLTDTLCICTNAPLGQALSACMLANCTIADTIGTARVNAQMCMLVDESQRSSVVVYTITVYAVSLTLVILRIASKIVSKRLAWNDAPVVMAVLLAAIPISCVLAMTKIGFGEHLWDLEDGTFLPILRYFHVAWSTYVAILGMIKLSLIMFYLDIFPTRSFRILGWIVFWYIAINTLVIFLLTIFACTPISAFWDRDLKGKCMNIQMLGYANSISAIVQDVILVILPMSYIRNLQMKRSRKIAVAVMFLIGSFGCVTTIVRLQTLLVFKISYDPTWDYVPIVIWTELEVTAAFACVSLPAIRVLIVKMTPKRLKGWLSDVTHGSSHNAARRASEEPRSRREWRVKDRWITISSTEHAETFGTDKIGVLSGAETSTSRLRDVNSISTFDSRSLTVITNGVQLVDLETPLPRPPVCVRSKFSS